MSTITINSVTKRAFLEATKADRANQTRREVAGKLKVLKKEHKDASPTLMAMDMKRRLLTTGVASTSRPSIMDKKGGKIDGDDLNTIAARGLAWEQAIEMLLADLREETGCYLSNKNWRETGHFAIHDAHAFRKAK